MKKTKFSEKQVIAAALELASARRPSQGSIAALAGPLRFLGGNRTERYVQVGDAVPIPLAYRSAEVVRAILAA